MTKRILRRPIPHFQGIDLRSDGTLTWTKVSDVRFWEEDGIPHIRMVYEDWRYTGPRWKLILWAFYWDGTRQFDGIEPHYLDGDPENLSLDNVVFTFFDRKENEWRPVGYREEGNLRVIDRRMGRKVMVVETQQIYDNAREAARAIGGSPSGVSQCLNGLLRTHKGYRFEYF